MNQTKSMRAFTLRQKKEGLKVLNRATGLRFNQALKVKHPVYASLENAIKYAIRTRHMTKHIEVVARGNELYVKKINKPLWIVSMKAAMKQWGIK